MRTGFRHLAIALCILPTLVVLAAGRNAQRETVLKQIDLPHHYYYREMYLPQLTTGPSSVAWSLDGKEVVYSMGGSLWRQSLDSTDAREVTCGPGYDYQPDWSRDSRWIVFARYTGAEVELHALEVATGKVRPLTSGGAVNVEPRFSPDGARLAFVSTRQSGRFRIFTGSFREGQLSSVEPLTRESRSDLPRYYYSRFDHEISPAWSPDGSEILFVSNRGRLYGTGGLWRMPAAPGADAREIYFEETTWKARPDWSPDGRRIIFSSYLGRQWHQLGGLPADGGTSIPMSYGEYDNTSPRWSPDGRLIAFISNRSGNTSLWIQDAASGEQRELPVRRRTFLRSMGRLRIKVLDPAGKPAPARVSVTSEDGRAYAPDEAWMHADDSVNSRLGPFEAHYFHSRGDSVVTVPAGKVQVEVLRGFEHGFERASVVVRSGETAAVTVQVKPLAAFADSARWVSGDLHVHMNYGGAYRATPKTLIAQAEAEDLSVVHNLIVNKEIRIPDVAYFTGRPDSASTPRTLLLSGQEFHTSSWGHLGLLGLKKHLLIPDYADYPQTVAASLAPSNPDVADAARRQGGLVGYVHPFDHVPDPAREPRMMNALPVSVALGKADYLEVVGFSDHRATAEVWYRLLNCGFRLPAGAGTDAMTNFASLRGPVGTNRVYVRVPSGPLNMDTWLEALRRGRSIATNGPLLRFALAGQNIGGEVKLPAGRQALPFTAALRSVVPVERLELVCNGKVERALALSDGGTSADASGTVRLERSGWCVLRAWSSLPQHPVLDSYPYATTSPVYVTLGGAPPRSPEDAAYFVAWIDRVTESARAHQGWNNPKERDAVLSQLAAARAVFAAR